MTNDNLIKLDMTKDDAIHELKNCGCSDFELSAMIGILECKIALGSTPIDAFEYVLKCRLGL